MSKKWPEVKNFYPTNPEKYIGDLTNIKMRSSWEIKFAKYCDTNPSVLKWNSEDIHIPYWSTLENKQRTYRSLIQVIFFYSFQILLKHSGE